MEFLLLLALAATLATAAAWRRREVERAALAAHDLHAVTEAAGTDLARLRDALDTLHAEALLAPADHATARAMEWAELCGRRAAARLDECQAPGDVVAVTRLLEEGHYALAAAWAARRCEPAPQRRPPCFFNPQHGPAATQVRWAPANRAEHSIGVCAMDARRLSAGGVPDVRMLRNGHLLVPWWRAGDVYAPYVEGYHGPSATDPDWSTPDPGEQDETFVSRWNSGDWRAIDSWIRG